MTPPASRFPTLTDQLYQLASGEVTSAELVRRSLHAIAVSQSTLNAFRVVLTETALADAAAADRRRAARGPGTAAGCPDRGQRRRRHRRVPTAFGTSGHVRPATQDAEVVRRLKAAGAVIVGKTNTCELGQWPFTSGPGFGHTRNPWSRRHTPGGSSGGSAAAVAAGLVTAAIGSDGAGSVRIPAAWTHLVGIKPQRGRISTWPLREAFNGITVNGVLARTVADAALVLDAASGNVDGDLHKPRPVTVSDHVGIAPGPLRIALSTGFPFTGFPARLHPEIRAALESVGDQLRLLGHSVVSGNPDYGLRLSWNFLSRSTSGLLEWAERLGDGVELDCPHAVEYADGTAAFAVDTACRPGARSRRSAPGGLDFPHRGRRGGADDRAAAAAGARIRQVGRLGHRPRDDRRLPGDLAVECVGVAVDQRPGRLHLRRACRSAYS